MCSIMSVSGIILVFVLSTINGYVAAACSDGFLKHGQSCYHFSHDTETWLDAVDACEKLFGAYLAEIQDADENNFLINEVNRLANNFWIGGDDLQVEGEWKWINSKSDITYSTWSPGNPSNSNGDENCMEIHDDDGRGPLKPLWNDNACHVFQRYICEKPDEEGQIIG